MPYDSLTVAQLKEALKAKGLPLGGLKSELVQRLTDADDEKVVSDKGGEEQAAAAETAPSAPEPATAEPVPAASADAEVEEDDVMAKRMKRFGDGVLTDEDRRKRREDRFKTGDVIHDSEKLSARADRFGILTEEKKQEQALARAKRFNVDAPEILEEKKKARTERFSKPVAAAEAAPSLSELGALIKKKD